MLFCKLCYCATKLQLYDDDDDDDDDVYYYYCCCFCCHRHYKLAGFLASWPVPVPFAVEKSFEGSSLTSFPTRLVFHN